MKFQEGDFVVTHDYRRGFVLGRLARYGFDRYEVLLTQTGKTHHYQELNLSLSGVEPTDEECAVFARYHLTGSVNSD